MRKSNIHRAMRKFKHENRHPSNKRNFIPIYRVNLVKDNQIRFEQSPLQNAGQAQPILQKLIQEQGQSDREQFCVALLNAKNQIIGLNIVATGDLSSATVHIREVFKPVILGNAWGILICHTHPSEDLNPSAQDIIFTRRMVHAGRILGIEVRDHIIISMTSDQFYSFADNEMIRQFHDEMRDWILR
jgi:DNA repair protein RadC